MIFFFFLRENYMNIRIALHINFEFNYCKKIGSTPSSYKLTFLDHANPPMLLIYIYILLKAET